MTKILANSSLTWYIYIYIYTCNNLCIINIFKTNLALINVFEVDIKSCLFISFVNFS